MASSATLIIQNSLGKIPVRINQYKDDKAFGNGTAIM
jgi:RNA 3'-terminal phosphate cyclase (ATP)